MVKILRHRKGFTLTEVLIVVAIVGVIALVLPPLVIQFIKFYQLHTAKIEIQREGRASLDIITRHLRQAEADTIVVDQVTGQPPLSRVSFDMIDGKHLVFYQSGNDLMMVESSTSTLATTLRYLAFTYPRTDDPSILSVAMTMEQATYDRKTKALELSVEKVRIMN